KPVGRLSARLSGGAVRGWLTLPDAIDLLGGTKRIMVFQHPQTAPQLFDIGDFIQPDPTGTRVWYTVSAAHGSSGGAAVDIDGKLFALQNAEVEDPPLGIPQRVNQGVRIDLIAQDLATVKGWDPAPPPDEEPLSFWSLSDDPLDPKPIIGRTA